MSNAGRLAAAGLELPAVPAPAAAYVPAVRHGDLVIVSGQLPLRDGALLATGLVGADVTQDEAAELARVCALNALAAAASVVGDLDAIASVLRVATGA